MTSPNANSPHRSRRGVYPGSFNPPTLAHVAIARAAISQFDLDHLDLVISRNALGKGATERPTLAQRVSVLEDSLAGMPCSVEITDLRLIADIADGYQVVVMGADKWHQVNDARFYANVEHLSQCLARLPELAVAERGDDSDVPIDIRLRIAPHLRAMSSTAARASDPAQMTAAARAFSETTGLWTSD